MQPRTFALKIILLQFLMALPSILVAQPVVTSMNPRQNEINVPSSSIIKVVFSTDMNSGTLTSSTVLVSGSQTGFYGGNVVYDAPTRTVAFAPLLPFKEGELISVVLTGAVENTLGQALSRPFQYSFTIAVEFGTGAFDDRIEISIGRDAENPIERDPTAIYAGDFDNDQFVDLAVVNNTTNSVSILMNRFASVTGSFEVIDSVPVGNGPNAITGGDFDNDGLLDLAVANFDDNSISVLRNTGGGIFAQAHTIFTAEHPTFIEARDYNSDGQVDLAVVILGINRLQVYQNQGGVFANLLDTQATGASPYGFTTGDFDNDGDLDIVVTNSGDNSIIVYKNDGTAQFSNSGEVSVPDFPTMVVANDLVGRTAGAHGDGFIDLVLVHPNINAVSIFDNRSRDGGFVQAQQLDVGLRPSGIFVGDVDTTDATAQSAGFGKEHDLDLAVPSIFSNDAFILRNQFNNNFIHNSYDVYAAGATPYSITGADFDRDGDIDLAVTNLNAHGVSILLNQGGFASGIRFNQPPGGIDFGQVYVGTYSTRSFTFFNPTDQIISLDNIGNTLAVFTPSETQAVVAPGEILNFSIRFAPTDTVAYQDSLLILSSVFAPAGELRIPMHGDGVRAILEVVPDTLNFGPVLPPQVATRSVEIFNRGNGALNISDMQVTNPAFSVPTRQLSLGPYSSQQLAITFQPQLPAAYLDTLSIFTNDSLNFPFLLLLLGGPNTAPPSITSADTVDAYEDSLFIYTASATDPDGTQPAFVFQNLPSWLALTAPEDPANDAVTGTPMEGFPDTSFTLIAVDGIFSDTLNVYVRVNPVNGPPQFVPITDQTTTELTFLSFNVLASDPEDSTLIISAVNLPVSAVFVDNGANTGTFSWVPPADSRGTYSVTFIAREAFESVPLSDTIVVNIEVRAALPDLQVESLAIPTTDIMQNQTHPVTGTVRAEFASITRPFRLTFSHDGRVVRDTVVTSLAYGSSLSVTYFATFSRLGSHEIIFAADQNNQIEESDEENNSSVLLLKAAKPRLVVRPNPFTPNSDGFNDEAVFDFGELVVTQPELKIFSFRGKLLATLNASLGSTLMWDGRDSSGKEQQPGMYLYVFSDNRKRIAGGYLVLAR